MPLDPDLAALLDLKAGDPQVSLLTHSAQDVRRAYREELLAGAGTTPLEPVADVRDERVNGVDVRVVTPHGRGERAAVVYLHGGGWVLGDNDVHEPSCRALANRAGTVVLSPDYRLAPEHPFPAALDDAVAVLRWAAERHPEVAVAGNSAGANLAAAACLRLRDEGGPAIAAQLLVYPATDPTMALPSHRELASGPTLDAAEMSRFYDAYLPDPALRTHPYAGPLHAPDLQAVPPAVVVTAGLDPLRDDGREYAARLGAAGVPVTLLDFPDLVHGFVGLADSVPSCRRARDAAYDALARLLDPVVGGR